MIRIEVQWNPMKPEPVHIGPNIALQRRYTVLVDDESVPFLARLEVEVQPDGKPTCRKLECEARPDGPPVTGDALRKLSLPSILRASTSYVALRIERTGAGKSFRVTPVRRPKDLERLDAAITKAMSGKRGRKPMTRERLEQVADLVGLARAEEARVDTFIAERLFVSEQHARRLLIRAREAGVLPKGDKSGSR